MMKNRAALYAEVPVISIAIICIQCVHRIDTEQNWPDQLKNVSSGPVMDSHAEWYWYMNCIYLH